MANKDFEDRVPPSEDEDSNGVVPWVSAVYAVVVAVALYMSFRRNKGFKLGPFLAAFLFPPLYIVYSLAVPLPGVRYGLK